MACCFWDETCIDIDDISLSMSNWPCIPGNTRIKKSARKEEELGTFVRKW